MHNSDTFVMVNCPGHPPLSPLPHLHMASSCPFLRRYKPSLHYHSPSSDTTEGPPFELCVAMATAPLRISRSLPTIAYADVDGCQTNHRRFFFFFFLSQEGRKPQIKFKLFGGCVCQGHLASVLMGRQIKAWFRTRVGEAQDSSASELGKLFQKLFDVKEMLEVV